MRFGKLPFQEVFEKGVDLGVGFQRGRMVLPAGQENAVGRTELLIDFHHSVQRLPASGRIFRPTRYQEWPRRHQGEEFGKVIAPGGSGVVIASQSGHRLPALSEEQNTALATTPVEEILKLPFLQPDKVTDPLNAYQIAKRGNSLRVMAEAVRWGKRGARINTISPGIIMTPLAKDELTGPRGAGYRKMLESSVAKRAGTPDEVATVAALLMGPDGAFITGSDFLMDGGVTAAYWFGDIKNPTTQHVFPSSHH